MSSATMAILTIGVVPLAGVLPLLTEHIREEQIAHISLLGEMTRDDVMAEYAVGDGEQGLLTLLSDNQLVMVSRQKIERDVRSVIAMLDRQHFDVILLLSSEQLTGFTTHPADHRHLFRLRRTKGVFPFRHHANAGATGTAAGEANGFHFSVKVFIALKHKQALLIVVERLNIGGAPCPCHVKLTH